MSSNFNINTIIKNGAITNQLDYERALDADRKLRLLAKSDSSMKTLRSRLRDIIEVFEKKHWVDENAVTDEQMMESDVAESISEQEQLFFRRRKEIIIKKLKKLGITQQEFGIILGHKSKSYTSELMNGICPFTITDLVLINQLLKINFSDLIPTFIEAEEKRKISSSIKQIKPNLKLSNSDFSLV